MERPASRARLAGLAALAVALAMVAPSGPARAEGKIRILEQFGISYLPLLVIRDQDLLARHGARAGIEIAAEWSKAGGGAAANDALLSGSVDVVSAGVGPLLTIWDRTRGNAGVKGIAAGVSMPFYLVTSNPDVKTIADFTDKDRIAVPSVGVSVQARTLQIAAAQAFGQGGHAALDRLTVSLPHPDATQALLSGSGTITAHFSNAPFQYQALKDPRIRKVLDSYEVLGGPATSVTLYTTSAFRDANPKTYRAFLGALEEANAWIAANKAEAAATYIRLTRSSLDPELVLSIIEDPQVVFTVVPQRTKVYADFLHGIGAVRTRAESWKDYFFPEIHDREGS